MTKTIGYIRVSTTHQATEGVSLEAQRRKIEAYCELHDLELVEIVEDAGLSAKTISGRPGMLRIMEMVKSRKVDALVIFKLDRLARNVREANEISELMQKKDVALHSISEKIDTASATGKLFFNILSAMGQWEREIISERTVMALQTKKIMKQRISGHAEFGYQFLTDGSVVPESSEQAIIARIQELRAAGFSIRAIQSELASEGYLNRNNKPLGRNEVWTILKKAA